MNSILWIMDTDRDRLLLDVGNFVLEWCVGAKYRRAYFGRLVDRLGERTDSRRALKALFYFAWSLKEFGEVKRALAIIQDVFDRAEHRDSLATQSVLGVLLTNDAQFDEAERVLRALATIETRWHGAAHRLALAARHELATSLLEHGKALEADVALQHDVDGDRYRRMFVEAGAIFRELVSMRSITLGDEHPDTLTAKQNLALLLRSDQQHNDDDEATALLRSVLDEERVLGAEHVHTLTARVNLALQLANTGRYEQAVTQLRVLLDVQRLALGPEHATTLSTQQNLGAVLSYCGLLDEALALFRHVLTVRQRVFRPEHPHTHAAPRNVVSKWCLISIIF